MVQYEGGYVRTPTMGIHKKIAVLDFKSLYPSIIVTHNIDPSTMNCKHRECKKNTTPGFIRWFCKKEEGAIPKRLKKILGDREDIKKKLKSKILTEKQREKLEKRQLQLKFAANLTYGYFGFKGSPYYNVKSAEAIAAFGRNYLKMVIEDATRAGFEVIYGDTDSIFLTKNTGKTKAFVNKINKKLPGIIELEYRGLYEKGLFVSKKGGEGAKKKYALIDRNGNLLIRGFESRRQDWCELAKHIQRKVLELVLNDKKKEAVKYVKMHIGKIRNRNVKVEDLIINEKLSKPLEKYKAVGPHVTVANKMKEEGHDVGEGTIISYVITIGSGSISQRAEPSYRASVKNYDPEYYINNQIIPSALRVLSVLNVEEEDLK